MPLSYTLYQSQAVIALGDTAHEEILSVCQRNNRRDALTGFLHREGDIFLQYLEGPEKEVQAALKRIKKDPRHANLEIISAGELSKRHFPDWQMGFVDGDQIALTDLIEVKGDQLDVLAENPFDLVVFMVSNADNLRSTFTKDQQAEIEQIQ